MRAPLIVAIGVLLASCGTCGDEPCSGSVVARAALRGFIGPIVVVTCIDGACGGGLVGAETCTESDPAGAFPFPFDVCYRGADAGSDATELQMVAGPTAASAIASGATWTLSVRSQDGTLEASSSVPASFVERDACGTTCLSGTFEFGTLEAAAP